MMKKESSSVSSLLGLSQQDLAMLLLVTRSQVAMFESGKRDLPASAMTRLAEMLTHVRTSEKKAKAEISTAQYQTEQQELERLLKKNEFQQLQLARQLAATARKLEAQSRLMQLADFLGNQLESKGGTETVLLNTKIINASKALDAKSLKALVRQQLKQELLVQEGQMLESKLKKQAKG